MEDALQIALSIAPAKAVAEACGIKVQAVYQWKVCPADRVLVVELLSGVSRHDLRPDVFGVAPVEAAE